MSKKIKQHQLMVTIEHAWLGISKSKQWKNQPFYYLDITKHNQLGDKNETIYAFFNLTNKDFWKVLEGHAFKDKKYLFWCEKRTRGWRLKEVKEL